MARSSLPVLLAFTLLGCGPRGNTEAPAGPHGRPAGCAIPTTPPVHGMQLALTPGQHAAVLEYAPVILQDTDARGVRPPSWDFITSHDFDGNLRGGDNEDNLRAGRVREMRAAVYYALTETQTHYFLVYSLFHPLDWDIVPGWFTKAWHENDMENIQVVVRKARGGVEERIVGVATQAHRRTRFDYDEALGACVHPSCRHPHRLALDPETGRPVVYVERGGHGIYGANRVGFVPARARRPEAPHILRFDPDATRTGEMYQPGRWNYRYALRSTWSELWHPARFGDAFGDGHLVDGSFVYADAGLCYPSVPRHYDSHREHLRRGDAGILPFAFSHDLHASDLGAMFFDPARKWAELFTVAGDWGTTYVHNPYRPGV